MRVVARGVVALLVAWALLGIHYFVLWALVGIVLARTIGGDVEATSGTVALVLTLTAVTLEAAVLARRRPGLLARWKAPAAVAALLVAAGVGVVLFWEHVYPCSAC